MTNRYANNHHGLIMMAFDDLPSKIRILMHDGQPYSHIYNNNRIEWSADDLDKFKTFWKCDVLKSLILGGVTKVDAARMISQIESLQ